MIQSAAASLPALQILVFIVCGVVGVYTVITALASHMNEIRRGGSPYAKTTSGLLFGSLMLSVPAVMEIASTSLFGAEGNPKIVESAVLTDTDSVRRTLHAITLYVTFIGWIACSNSIWTFKTGSQYQEQGWVRKGLVLLGAGACAANFALFVDILANTVNAEPLGTMYFSY